MAKIVHQLNSHQSRNIPRRSSLKPLISFWNYNKFDKKMVEHGETRTNPKNARKIKLIDLMPTKVAMIPIVRLFVETDAFIDPKTIDQ